jgi:two-component system nitrate/nitrite sensor histidine kinase NarX|tara:strand:+ start:1395 stop:2333 length:939 start_codon:yes stop_codon:yes gene_type:complete
MLSQKNKKDHEHEFIENLKQWALNIMSGDLSSRIKISKSDDLNVVCDNLNIVSEMLENQLNKTHEQFERFAKYKEDKNKEANRLAIIEERVHIASELHDSLAQTLASLKLQVRVLDESLQGIIYMKNNRKFKTSELYTDKRITDEIETLEESIELANREIRQLIGHFRSPPVIDNIASEISSLVKSFQSDNQDKKIFFQNKIPVININKNDELHIKRIAQEALVNVKKHSQAKIIRVLLMSYETGKYSLIVEDDGIGIAKSCFIGHDNEDTGEHVGLSIMRDRAQQIGGHLAIESEPGEGVRVILSFYEREN